MHLLAMSSRTGVRLAEVGFLLIVIAGVWLAVEQIPKFNFAASRTIVAGILLAVARSPAHHCHPLGSLRLAGTGSRPDSE